MKHFTVVCHGVRQEKETWTVDSDPALKYLEQSVPGTKIIPFYYDDLLEKAKSNKLSDGLAKLGMVIGHIWRPELFLLWELLPDFGDFVGDAAAYGASDAYPQVQQRLLNLMAELKRDNPQCKITLVGHSLGSLVVYEFDCIFPHMADKVVTLGSPMDLFIFRGAVLKRTGGMIECHAPHHNYVGMRDLVQGLLKKELNYFLPDAQFFLKRCDHNLFTYFIHIEKFHGLNKMIYNDDEGQNNAL